MIPKIIHYCWISGEDKMPKDIKMCIDSWHKHLPDYEFINWNDSNFDWNICEFTKWHRENNQYAFCSDYIRFWALYNYGGIYLDSDVFVKKSFDELLSLNRIITMENNNEVYEAAIIGSEKGDLLMKEVLDYYNKCNKHFDNNYSIISPWVMNEVWQYHKNINVNQISEVKSNNSIYILPRNKYFVIDSEYGFAQHYFKGSWWRNENSNFINISDNKIKTYEIIYIATGYHYIAFFNYFIKDLEKFCPNTVYKKVKLLTDIKDYNIEQYKNLKNINIELYYISHLPWPCVTLLKMHYINNFVDDNYDLLFYFNANCLIKSLDQIPSVLNYYDFYFYTPKNDPGLFMEWGTKDNPYDKNLPYVQGTIFCGNKKGMKHCCNYIINHINNLLLNNIIEEKHDESAMNHYLIHLSKTNEISYYIMFMSDILNFLNYDPIIYIYNNQELKIKHTNGFYKENVLDFKNYGACQPLYIK